MNTDEQKKTAKVEPKIQAEAKKENIRRFIYVGPNLRDGLATFSVFKGAIPKKYEEKFETNPEFKELFIDRSDFVKVKDEIGQSGTAINAAYRTVQEKGVI